MTNTRFRDFDAEAREVEGEPLAFRLGGEDFTTIWPLPIGVSMMVAGTLEENEIVQMHASAKALQAMIPEDQHKKWAKALSRVHDMKILQDLLAWFTEEATGRPTSGPSSSPEHSATGGPDTAPTSE